MFPFSHLLLSLHLGPLEDKPGSQLPLEEDGVVRYEDIELRSDSRREMTRSYSHTCPSPRLAPYEVKHFSSNLVMPGPILYFLLR